MSRVCAWKGCERGTRSHELCLFHRPKKVPRTGKHTNKDKYENRKFRESRLNHEGYLVCDSCNSWFGSDTDHIKKKSTHPDLRYDEANKQILCRDCHITKDK